MSALAFNTHLSLSLSLSLSLALPVPPSLRRFQPCERNQRVLLSCRVMQAREGAAPVMPATLSVLRLIPFLFPSRSEAMCDAREYTEIHNGTKARKGKYGRVVEDKNINIQRKGKLELRKCGWGWIHDWKTKGSSLGIITMQTYY